MDIVQRRPNPVKSGKVEGTHQARLAGQARRDYERTLTNRPNLRGSRLAVLRVLLDQWGWGKPSCRPSNATIAASAGLSVSTVRRCLHELAQLGAIEIAMGPHGEDRVIRFTGHPLASAPPTKMEVAPFQNAGHPPFQNDTQSVASFLIAETETLESSSPFGNEPTEIPEPRTPLGSARSPRSASVLDWRTNAPVDDPIIAAALKAPTAVYTARPGDVVALDEAMRGESESCNVEPAGYPQVAGDMGEVIKVLASLKPGATRQETTVATLRLTRYFRDPGSRKFYSSVTQKIGRGELSADVAVAGVRKAAQPGIVKPAAVFTAHVRRCEQVRESRRSRSD
jgi:hypothetical protein